MATGDTIAPRMAGPGIRAWQLAAALSGEHVLRLVTTAEATLIDERFEILHVDDAELAEQVAWCDVFVVQGWVMAGRPSVARTDAIVVVDLYDPMPLEQLEQGREAGDERGRLRAVLDTVAVMNEQVLRGDFFLCASAKQRDFYLGQMTAMGRINPLTYDDDQSLRRLIGLVPFGISDQPPRRTARGIRGVVPGIGADDHVVLWGGGIYNWLDPITVIDAIDIVRATVPDVRLFFMGGKHPNPEIPEMRMAVQARARADRLELTGRHVFFNDEWIDYDQRQNVLLDADLGINAHLHHIETEFSYRTRVLDYLWAGLPVVTTSGDALAELVAEHQLGVVVDPGVARSLADAVIALLTDRGARDRYRSNIVAVQPSLTWDAVTRPLRDFCRDPRRAPDRAVAALLGPRVGIAPRNGWRSEVALGRRYLEDGGIKLLLRRLVSRPRRLLRRRPSSERLRSAR